MRESYLHRFDHGPGIRSSRFSNNETGYAAHGISPHSKIAPTDSSNENTDFVLQTLARNDIWSAAACRRFHRAMLCFRPKLRSR